MPWSAKMRFAATKSSMSFGSGALLETGVSSADKSWFLAKIMPANAPAEVVTKSRRVIPRRRVLFLFIYCVPFASGIGVRRNETQDQRLRKLSEFAPSPG